MDTRLIICCDLGTSALTASHVQCTSYVDHEGKTRWQSHSVYQVDDWPQAELSGTKDHYLPTDLVFSRATKQLLFWGFPAQLYLTSIVPEIPFDEVFIVENIKLLLLDQDSLQKSSIASERYQAQRRVLIETLGKQPEQVFGEAITEVFGHIMKTIKVDIDFGIDSQHLELGLAFPAGWPESLHSNIAKISARAMKKALANNPAKNVQFGLEDVYTVSETVCGAREWLRRTLADPNTSEGGLKVNDQLGILDVGAGTTCITAVRILSTNPPGVEQLDKTQSLFLGGESVDAQFEDWVRPQIERKYYKGDISELVYKLRRQFKIYKTNCGLESPTGSPMWSIYVPGLQPNPKRSWRKDTMMFKHADLPRLFDPTIDVLQDAIKEMLVKFPSIKVIVFLGQFGGRSHYLHHRMENSDISKSVRIRHSRCGKFDVLNGGIQERIHPDKCFIRQYRCSKSYGTLINLPYNAVVRNLFPNPEENGAVPFDESEKEYWLKVIEWAIPKGTLIHNGRSRDIGHDTERQHTWPFSEKDIGFTDTIVVSDESPPYVELDGQWYTMWTIDHENDTLYKNGERLRVRRICFGWDLKMSQRLDAVGPYCENDLNWIMEPEVKIRGHRRTKLRELWYELIWDITEMQVKVHVRVRIPNDTRQQLSQLARERLLDRDERLEAGESRSAGLERDIQLTYLRTLPGNGRDRVLEVDNNGGSGSGMASSSVLRNTESEETGPAKNIDHSASHDNAISCIEVAVPEDNDVYEAKASRSRTKNYPRTGMIDEMSCTMHNNRGSPDQHDCLADDPTRHDFTELHELEETKPRDEPIASSLPQGSLAALSTGKGDVDKTSYYRIRNLLAVEDPQDAHSISKSAARRGSFMAIRGGKRGKK